MLGVLVQLHASRSRSNLFGQADQSTTGDTVRYRTLQHTAGVTKKHQEKGHESRLAVRATPLVGDYYHDQQLELDDSQGLILGGP